ncbi:hypothetical protein GY45DRAFT_1168621 [Cubamyces sp. BRFM 1775]|nr:hypothetical protein GY45DRAFT_1168621 [Cubamyces sp. BRFM 1775]
MALRTPFSSATHALSTSASFALLPKENNVWASVRSLGDENAWPSAGAARENVAVSARARNMTDVLNLALTIDAEAIAGASEGFSHHSTDYASSISDARASPKEEEATAPDEAESVDDNSDDDHLQRTLAFANRARSSGSGLPPILAQFYGAVEEMDDFGDEHMVDLVESIVFLLQDEREIQQEVASLLQRFAAWYARRAATGHGYSRGKPLTAEKAAFIGTLARVAAFQYVGADRLDTTSTQGLLPMLTVDEKKRPARPLRHKLFTYLCERDLYIACKHYGIPYEKPHRHRLDPDAKFIGEVILAERGRIGSKHPQELVRSR